MKCENCGKNEVSFLSYSNINGKVEQQCLCAECAKKLGYVKQFAANRSKMRDFFSNDFFGNDFFGDNFFGRGLPDSFFTPMSALMGRMLDNPFDDFFSDMPALTAGPAAQREEPKKADEHPVNEDDRNHYDQWRQLNALKLEMNKAVQEENFERAAELRDEIRRLENSGDTEKRDNK